MHPKLSRRDFLKLAGLLPIGLSAPRLLEDLHTLQPPGSGRKNVLIIVFDAWSAHNVSLYGYPRQTTPNIDRLAERAVVYHNHFAGGNFTTPGTASILTGTLPWTHRAFALNTAVDPTFTDRNIFQAFGDSYRIAYSHNNVVNTLFSQFSHHLDEFVPRTQLYLTSDGFINDLFSRDDDIASVSWFRLMKKSQGGSAYSLLLSGLYELLRSNQLKSLKSLFPRGFPGISGDNYFLLEQAIDWFGARLARIPQPFFGYLHFLPPHYPYRTRQEFYGRFKNDGFKPVDKPVDVFSLDKSPDASTANLAGGTLLEDRTYYDEFILYIDHEFGKFFDTLESSGLLENTVVVLTSDHGELFERGIEGHSTAVLFQPVIHVPLLIFEPGRRARLDVHIPTSAVDLLPTLLHLTGQPPAAWTEGMVLPPFADQAPDAEQTGRSLYALQARSTKQNRPIQTATAMLVKGRYKLVYYFGYKRLGKAVTRAELYDLDADPEELNDLSSSQKKVAASMLRELKATLAEKNQPYRKRS